MRATSSSGTTASPTTAASTSNDLGAALRVSMRAATTARNESGVCHPSAHARQLQRVQRHAAGSRRELLAALDPRHELTDLAVTERAEVSSDVPRTAGCPSLGAAWRARVER